MGTSFHWIVLFEQLWTVRARKRIKNQILPTQAWVANFVLLLWNTFYHQPDNMHLNVNSNSLYISIFNNVVLPIYLQHQIWRIFFSFFMQPFLDFKSFSWTIYTCTLSLLTSNVHIIWPKNLNCYFHFYVKWTKNCRQNVFYERCFLNGIR